MSEVLCFFDSIRTYIFYFFVCDGSLCMSFFAEAVLHRCSHEKMFWKNAANLQEKTPCRSMISIKLLLRHGCTPANCCIFSEHLRKTTSGFGLTKLQQLLYHVSKSPSCYQKSKQQSPGPIYQLKTFVLLVSFFITQAIVDIQVVKEDVLIVHTCDVATVIQLIITLMINSYD